MPSGRSNFVMPADCNTRTRDLFAYWQSVHPATGIPGRQHIDPAAITALLPNVWLVDVQRTPLRFRYRLIGTRIAEFYGVDYTGKWLDEVFPQFIGSETHSDCEAIAADGQPRWRRGKPYLNYEEDFNQLERIFLPLAANGTDVDMLFCLTVFFDTEGSAH